MGKLMWFPCLLLPLTLPAAEFCARGTLYKMPGIPGGELITKLWGAAGSLALPAQPNHKVLQGRREVAGTPCGLEQTATHSGEDKGKLFAPLSSLHICSGIWL